MSQDVIDTSYATAGERIAAAIRLLKDAKKGMHIYSHARAEINLVLIDLELVAMLAEQDAK